jgi:hypothetical protein
MNNNIINILKKNPIIILFLFCLFNNVYICFANDNIKKYMEQNNMNYPYNLNTDINNSVFMDRTLDEYDEDKYIKQFKLTLEQINALTPFFSELKVINMSDNFKELKNQRNVIAFSILDVYIFREGDKNDYIYVSIRFYSDKKLGDMSKYDNEYKFWSVHNIAVYSLVDYEFKGWVF